MYQRGAKRSLEEYWGARGGPGGATRSQRSQGKPGGARGVLDQRKGKRSIGEYREVKRSQGEEEKPRGTRRDKGRQMFFCTNTAG